MGGHSHSPGREPVARGQLARSTSPQPSKPLMDWEQLLAMARRRYLARQRRLYAEAQLYDGPCEMVLTSDKRRGAPDVLVVLCRCMAGTRGEPSARFYNYDALGRVVTLPEALQAWRDHRDARPGGKTMGPA